jgi:TRAP transporter TAXI family solute receptor
MARSFITTLLTALLVAGALAGCADNGGDGGNTTTSPGTTTTPATTTPTSTTPVTTPVIPSLPASGPSDVYGLTSGSTGGVYYAIANGIQAAVRNATAPGFTISEVPTSGGSVTNVERLRQDDYQLALMQNDVAFLAYNGEGQFADNSYTGLRAVASLYPEMIQIVTLASSDIGTIDDLAGKRVAVGAAGSGVAVGAADILTAAGITVTEENLDLTTSTERLKDGGIDAFFWIGGIPTGAITALGTTDPVRIVPISAALQTTLQEDKPFYASVTLPADTYPGQSADVETVAVIAILVARDDVPADDVASLLRIIFDGTDVQSSHPGQGPNIKIENSQEGVSGIPWHDGAKYYFALKGMPVE